MSSTLTNVILNILIFFLPLLFWTITPNFFATPKEFIFTLSTLFFVIYFIYSLIKSKKITFPSFASISPIVSFLISILLSIGLNPEGRPEAIAGKGMILILLPLFSLLLLSLPKSSNTLRNVLLTLIFSSSLLAIHSLTSLTFLSSTSFIPSYMQNKAFTPTGSYLTTLSLLILSISASIELLKTASQKLRLYLYAHVTIATISVVAIISLMLPGSVLAPNLLPIQASWSIALDALKSLRTFLFGIGLANYSLLYTSVKPLSLNSTSLWNIIPTSSSSELLTLLATAGIIPTLTLIFLMLKGLLKLKNKQFSATYLILILFFIFTPLSLIHYVLLFIFLSLSSQSDLINLNLSPRNIKILAVLFIILTTTISLILFKPFASEYFMRRAQIALTKNDGKNTYDNHLRALTLYPKMTSYHISFASINLNLASSLSQKPNLSDEDRQTITKLIQQAIQSSKNATALRPNDTNTWLALANTYRNLINVAQGSDQFALDAYTRSIALDRANPITRIQYGGLLYQLSKISTDQTQKNMYLTNAKTEFQTAIQLKKDYPNSYYNLAKTFEESKDYASAVALMQEVVKYLPSESSDYQQAMTELDNLKSKIQIPTPTQATPSANNTLISTPSPLPSPLPGGQVELDIIK